MIEHYAIVQYWKDKGITSNGKVVSAGTENSELVVEDWGEPMCWGCSKPIISDVEKRKQGELTDEDVKDIWSAKKISSKLNRCHITAKSLGGSDEAYNLFLMCHECHFLSPDTINREAFFRWVYKRRRSKIMGVENPEEIIRLVNIELADRGVPDCVAILDIFPDIRPELFKRFVERRITSHASKIATSTLVVAIADWLETELGKRRPKKI